MSTMTISRPTSLKLDQDIKERVQKLAEHRHRSSHWIMVEAIKQYIEKEEKRESFKKEALESWREYQETGLHISGGEAIAWLETWGEDNEQEMPTCHK